MPVEPATLTAFVLTAAAIVASPGPDTFLILRCALTSGRAVGYAAVAGVQLGLLVHTAFAVFGLSVLIARSPVLFNAMAFAGALYLAWLGIQGFRDAGNLIAATGGKSVSAGGACRAAMLTNVLNPKVLVLFLALYPNFVDTGRGQVTAQLMTLSATLIVINIAWQAPMAWAAHYVRRWLVRPKVRTAVVRTASVVLIGFAIALVIEHLR